MCSFHGLETYLFSLPCACACAVCLGITCYSCTWEKSGSNAGNGDAACNAIGGATAVATEYADGKPCEGCQVGEHDTQGGGGGWT